MRGWLKHTVVLLEHRLGIGGKNRGGLTALYVIDIKSLFHCSNLVRVNDGFSHQSQGDILPQLFSKQGRFIQILKHGRGQIKTLWHKTRN